ncbi:hypothetical protein EHV15_35830 [Paenibacillus oralis]|uniref:Uncharacterized protein n=1 Tax=Paenibacillus oralis TaxID=2490856 RepID=A0A3P3TEV0_9BACL|nr:hypothetical protein [Paenibacillus oralis]RRJ54943.1 hypothetical protein EHV15_35830 [Paenibacillus oralis]
MKWFIYMIPALIGQGIIMYFFRPQSVSSLAIGTPIFLLLSVGNIIVYNILFIPKKIRTQVKEVILGKHFGWSKADDYEDILTEIINDSKARQAAYDGYLRTDLVQLHADAVQKENRFRKLAKFGQWFTYLFFFLISAYYVIIPEFQMSIIYFQWGLGLAIVTTAYQLGRREVHWGYQKITLIRCLEKCGEEDRFYFDNDI